MIDVKLTLLRHGDKNDARDLGRAEIANVGRSQTHGRYHMPILKGGAFSHRAGELWREFTLVDVPMSAPPNRDVVCAGFPRKSRAVGPWELLWACLEGALKDRTGKLITSAAGRAGIPEFHGAMGDLLMAIARPAHVVMAAQALAALVEQSAEVLGIPVRDLLKTIDERIGK